MFLLKVIKRTQAKLFHLETHSFLTPASLLHLVFEEKHLTAMQIRQYQVKKKLNYSLFTGMEL